MATKKYVPDTSHPVKKSPHKHGGVPLPLTLCLCLCLVLCVCLCFMPLPLAFLFALYLCPLPLAMMFFGKDCRSLAVAIGKGLDLNPILLHSTSTNDRLGVLSVLTKDLQGVVMGFLSDPNSYSSTIYDMIRNGDARTEYEILSTIRRERLPSELARSCHRERVRLKPYPATATQHEYK